jgi:hypothetical protein
MVNQVLIDAIVGVEGIEQSPRKLLGKVLPETDGGCCGGSLGRHSGARYRNSWQDFQFGIS